MLESHTFAIESMKTTKKNRGAVRKTIFLKERIYQVGEKRAESVQRNFSNYVGFLIARDNGLMPDESKPAA